MYDNKNEIETFREPWTDFSIIPHLHWEAIGRIYIVYRLYGTNIMLKATETEQKRLTFAKAATGSSGIETWLSLSLELFHNGSVKLNTIIEALTCNPAKILKINKGNPTVGNDADFCIVDINKPWIVKNENLLSKSKNTSIENKKLQGKVINTFINGEELYKM